MTLICLWKPCGDELLSSTSNLRWLWHWIVLCVLGGLFLIHQMRIPITTHYLKSGQEASPGVRASALEGKAAVPIYETHLRRTQWNAHWDSFIPCCESVDTFDSLTDFNSRSTLRNGTLTNTEDVSSSLPGVPHYAGTKSITSWSQKTGETDTLPPLTSPWVLELCGIRQGVSSSSSLIDKAVV